MSADAGDTVSEPTVVMRVLSSQSKATNSVKPFILVRQMRRPNNEQALRLGALQYNAPHPFSYGRDGGSKAAKAAEAAVA
jgi:hypothetical protein